MSGTAQKTLISPSCPFPRIAWWAVALSSLEIFMDEHEPFRKMTDRNRYKIAGSNNPVLLSVPLVAGRDQHVPVSKLRIFNRERWQVRHWRTLVSVYRRTPFFEHYEPGLARLFETEYELLTDFNRATLDWVATQIRMTVPISPYFAETASPADSCIDLRKQSYVESVPGAFPEYYQIFSERISFQPNLSILDLLFSEGPATGVWIKKHSEAIIRCCFSNKPI